MKSPDELKRYPGPGEEGDDTEETEGGAATEE